MRDKRSGSAFDPVLLRRSVAWRARLMTARWRRLPDFVIIGTQRGGTTSLFDFLADHPAIEPSFRKEVHFHDLHFSRGTGWYRAHFPIGDGPGRITGEATPNYLFHPDAPRRLNQVTPAARLVVVLRNPIDRAHSAWRLKAAGGHEPLSFAGAVEREMTSPPPELGDYHEDRRAVGDAMRLLYLAKSRYGEQMARWLGVFDLERFCIVTTEDLFAHPRRTLAFVTDSLGVAPMASDALPQLNRTPSEEIDPGLRRDLADYFRPDTALLGQLLGRAFDWD